MNLKPLCIQNAFLVRGDGSLPRQENILITYPDGKGILSEIGVSDPPPGCNLLDARGLYAMPAFVDIGCRFFDPKHPARESIASASSAALGGGCLTLLCEPDEGGNALPDRLTRTTDCRLLPAFFSLSPAVIASSGPRVYSDNGRWITDPALMRELMLSCAASDSLWISSCGDPRLIRDGVSHPGQTARLLGLPTVPESAETTAAARDILLCAETGCRLHFRAVSSRATLELIRIAKQRGIRVTCGVSPLHYSMTDSDLFYYGGSAKVMPPLRAPRDREAVREAMRDGTIDCVATLHTPLTAEENCRDLRRCRFGASGLDTAFSSYFTNLIRNGLGDFDLAAKLFSLRPAAILGLDSRLQPCAPADLILFDPDAELVVSTNTLKSKAVNTPFLGQTLNGCIRAVFSEGRRL